MSDDYRTMRVDQPTSSEQGYVVKHFADGVNVTVEIAWPKSVTEEQIAAALYSVLGAAVSVLKQGQPR